MKRTIAIIVLLLFICGGCSWFETKDEKTAKELADEGISEFSKGNYTLSIELFEKLKTWYPFSSLVILSELKIADAYYALKKYDEAVSAYSSFEKLHPNNEKIPYTFYKVGCCYLKQINTIDRDQTPAENSLRAFERLINLYPDSEYTHKAVEHLITCQKSLAEHEFSIGFFYYKTKHYKSALYRFKAIIAEYPDIGVQHKALQYIPLCEIKIKQMEKEKAEKEKENKKEEAEEEEEKK